MHAWFRLAPFLCLLVPATLKAQQASVYATVDESIFSPVSNGKPTFTTRKFGFIVGGFYNFDIDSRFKPGVDVRLVESPNSSGGTAVLVAFRGSFVPDHNPLRPYFQLGGGFVSVANGYSGANTATRANGGGVEFDFGLDVRLTPRLDLRLPELGAAVGGKVGTSFLGGGLVYHPR